MPKKKKTNFKKLKPVFHIFCEGEKTEPYYIRGYINHFHSDKRNLIVIENSKKNTPVQLVHEAVEKRKKSNLNDIFWVVFDRESVAKYSHELHLKARKKANDNGIEIAFSNICFEFWLLLHFVYSSASYENCDDLLKHSPLRSKFSERGIKNYDKGLACLFDSIKEDVPIAFKNAERIMKNAINTAEKGRESPSFLNPYTDVHELFFDIKNFVNGKKSVRNKGIVSENG